MVRGDPARKIELATTDAFATLEHRDRWSLHEQGLEARGVGPF